MLNIANNVFKSSACIRRYPGNPLLTPAQMPFASNLVFNAAVAKYQGEYIMLFRSDYGYSGGDNFAGTQIGLAQSQDGINWEVSPKPVFEPDSDEITRAYDPRLIVLEGKCYVCFAAETRHGLRGGIAVTEDFDKFEIISLSVPDNRNLTLFPEKVNGKYVRLERPMPFYSRHQVRFDIWISDSPDLKYWGNSQVLLAVEDVPFANNRIGPAAPPVKTDRGWLTVFHAVESDPSRGKNGWEDVWQKTYYAGIMLLDLENPTQIIGMSKVPLLAPETNYEREGGYRNDVIFPGGMILEDSGEVKLYYGAADTVECLATAHVDDLIRLCDSPKYISEFHQA
jgi:beta-1,4-mannooligosaccharide/beta-1,4-mannosyl-N-acetylglucosamine phosphorylase